MSKDHTPIPDAAGYGINAKGEVKNLSKGNPVFPNKDGAVGLYSGEGSAKIRKFFKISDLMAQLHPDVKVEGQKEKKQTAPRAGKTKKESGADLIRSEFDKATDNGKHPDKFGKEEMQKFSETSGIPYGRVYGCVKKHKEGKK